MRPHRLESSPQGFPLGAMTSSYGRQPDPPASGEQKGQVGGSWEPMKIPDGLTCKNTFFDIPAVDELSPESFGPATCPIMPTEGWWASPSPSRDASPNIEDIGPTPDWFTTPHPPQQELLMGSTSGTSKSATSTSMSRFDRLLMEATADSEVDDEDKPDEDRAEALPSGFGGFGGAGGIAFQTSWDSSAGGSATQTPLEGTAGGLNTPWEDTPNFSTVRSCHVAGLPPVPTYEPGVPPSQAPPPQPHPSRFDMLLEEATKDDGAEASRRSSVNSNSTLVVQTPWEGTAGFDTPLPWEDSHFAAAHGFTYPPPHPPPQPPVGPLLAAMGAGLTPLDRRLVEEAARRDFARGYNMTDPLHLPQPFAPGLEYDTGLEYEPPLPATGPLLSVPPPGSLPGRRVVVDLASELGFRHGGLLLAPTQIGPDGTCVPAAKARRRRGSKEAKQPDRAKDPTWWLPSATYIDLGGLVKVPKRAAIEPAADPIAAMTA